MNKFLAFISAMLLAAAPAFADSSSSAAAGSSSGVLLSPTQSQGQTNNVSGISNPLGENQNIQINNQQTTSYGLGMGITCQGPSVAVSGYGGLSQIPGYSSSNAYGVNVALVTPVGGPSYRACNALASEVVRQRQLGTQMTMIDKCIEIMRAGYKVDERMYPELARACAGLHRNKTEF